MVSVYLHSNISKASSHAAIPSTFHRSGGLVQRDCVIRDTALKSLIDAPRVSFMTLLIMLRSAFNKTSLSVARCCQSILLPSTHSASLSTVSYYPSDVSRKNYDDASQVLTTPSSISSTSLYNNITSLLLSMMIPNNILGGDLTLVTVDKIASKLEEEDDGELEDISTTTLTTTTTTNSIMESLQQTSIIMEEELSLWQISTLKRRKKMMNKHKLRKRKKKLRLRTRK